MKFVMMSVGTRGDMEPFLAIGQGLRDRGHRVTCVFPAQFESITEQAGLGFESLGPDFLDLLDSDLGRAALGGGGSAYMRLAANVRLASRQTRVNRELVERQRELIENQRVDRVLYNGKAIYPVLWEADHPGKTILISPVPFLHYVRGHTHVAFHTNLGAPLNRLTYALADFGQAVTAKISARWLRRSPAPTLRSLKGVLRVRRVVYTISPTLFPRPKHWGRNLQVLGHHERLGKKEWSPSEALQSFLNRHADAKILFATFGSMTNPEPKRRTEALVDVLVRNRIPTIINTASGGLVPLEGVPPDLIHFTSAIPYEYVFPRVYGVLHHGGSGTTHLALRAGCVTMVVPHIIDQFAWSRIVEELGVGPAGLSIGEFTASRLEPMILALLSNHGYKKRAQDIGIRMASEELEEELFAQLER